MEIEPKLQRIDGGFDCADRNCPAVYDGVEDMYVIKGYVADQALVRQASPNSDEQVVVVPKAVIDSILGGTTA